MISFIKWNWPFAALLSLAVSSCGQGNIGTDHKITPQSVNAVFGAKPASSGGYFQDDDAVIHVRDTFRYSPAIRPAGCPKEARTLVSWNGGNLGEKKSSEAAAVMADVTREADIVLFQEVSTSEFGARAVAKIQDGLSRTGNKWDMATSGATIPKNAESEAYGTLWKPSRTAFVKPTSGLVTELAQSVSREPFRSVFIINGKRTLVYSFHAVPAKKKPKIEIETLVALKELRDAEFAIVAGDFNLSAKEANPLFEKIGFVPVIAGKTSLKKTPDEKGRYRHKDFDHIYVKGLTACAAGIVDFPERNFAPITAKSFERAKEVSDHLPVWVAVH